MMDFAYNGHNSQMVGRIGLLITGSTDKVSKKASDPKQKMQ